MPRAYRILEPNVLFHIINRGNDKQIIFQHSSDYLEYIQLLERYKQKFNVKIYHFVLMPNHIHLLLEPTTHGSLPKFMQGLTLAHTKNVNHMKKRSGHLWQGRFKSIPIQDDLYYFKCAIYIELNPVRAQLTSEASQYPWSSYSSQLLKTHKNIVDQHPLYTSLENSEESRKLRYGWMMRDEVEKIKKGTNENLSGLNICGNVTFLKRFTCQT